LATRGSQLTPPSPIDRASLIAWYLKNRARSKALFDLLEDDAYYSQPIALRHPIVFYDGHLPAFSVNTLVTTALGGSRIDAHLEALFARGIDPAEDGAARDPFEWPRRDVVQQFGAEADRRVLDVLMTAALDRPGHPLLDRAEAVFTILEHEAMHQETLLYIWHRLPFASKRRPADYRPELGGAPPRQEWIDVPTGHATLGVDRDAVPFGWDNEFPSLSIEVPTFALERHNVTNAAFLEFVDAGGYADSRWWTSHGWHWIQREHVGHPAFWERQDGAWYWRGMFDAVPLPPAWPVYVSQAEAAAFAQWRGHRLLTEAEFQRAAYGAPRGEARRYPWGNASPESARGAVDFATWDPYPCGSRPAGRSAWGVDDLVGNGWEWTSTAFAPFPGFRAMASYPQYSADFFDGEHVVMKGASTATARELIRPSFRNWFRAHYPYVYATFRCAKDLQ
jgi:gamma-glutamyl hercynylcysteine S-oxide synthase